MRSVDENDDFITHLVIENNKLKSDNEKMKQTLKQLQVLISKFSKAIEAVLDKYTSDEQELTVDASSDI